MSFSFTKPTTRPEWAASIAVCLFGIMAAVQVGVAVGFLPSDIVWGGANEELTLWARVTSLAMCVILCGLAYVIYRRTQPMPSKSNKRESWFICAYMAINTFANLMGTTWVEKYVFGTITLVLFICTWIVASSEPLDPPAIDENGAPTAATPLSAVS